MCHVQRGKECCQSLFEAENLPVTYKLWISTGYSTQEHGQANCYWIGILLKQCQTETNAQSVFHALSSTHCWFWDSVPSREPVLSLIVFKSHSCWMFWQRLSEKGPAHISVYWTFSGLFKHTTENSRTTKYKYYKCEFLFLIMRPWYICRSEECILVWRCMSVCPSVYLSVPETLMTPLQTRLGGGL